MRTYILVSLLLTGAAMSASTTTHKKAIFAGGCFWCMEADFEKIPGVTNVVSGYIGGTQVNPTYQNYSRTGHVEAIEVTYNPTKTSYKKLLAVFWRSIDPTDPDGQFVDRGKQYRSEIFYLNEEQKNLAQQSKEKLQQPKRFSKPIVTEITQATAFYPAEEYHQNYHKKKPWRYWWYRRGSGRDTFLNKVWGI